MHKYPFTCTLFVLGTFLGDLFVSITLKYHINFWIDIMVKAIHFNR